MKKVHIVVKAAMLFVMGCFLSCRDISNTDITYESYPTTTIDSLEVTAEAYPGVNILTWKAVKDAGTYSVYKTTGEGNRETLILDASKETVYCDTDIETASIYKYRVIAHPVDATVHDATQQEVSLTTQETWPDSGTTFLDLARNDSDQNAQSLSASSISASLLASSGLKIHVKFPVKPYAKYTVKVGQPGGAALNNSAAIDTSATLYGYDYNGTATVDIAAVYSGEKEVTIVATPLSSRYHNSTVVASSRVTVESIESIASAVKEMSVNWTNYESWSKTAYARVRFVPAELQGKVFSTSNYTVYRAIINSSGETIEDGTLRVYTSITELAAPQKDIDSSTASTTVYYVDDSLDISVNADVSSVRYYVVLNYNNKIRNYSKTLRVPSGADGNWNFTPDTPSESSTYIQNLTVDTSGYLRADIFDGSFSSHSFTYDSFSTYNQALVAVEKELSQNVSLSWYYSYDEYEYNYSGTSNNSLTNVGNYYAFRLVSKKTNEEDAVHKIIAVLRQTEGVYWLEVMSEDKPRGYYHDLVSIPYVRNVSKELGDSTYTSVSFEYQANTISGSAYVQYNILRNDSFLTTTSSEQYTDDSSWLRYTSLGTEIWYNVQAIGRYNVSEPASIRVLGLAAPRTTLRYDYDRDDTILDWDSVYGADYYEIWRTTSLDFGYYDNYSICYDPWFTITNDSYKNDYYYVVRACSNEHGYSNLSNYQVVYKKVLGVPNVYRIGENTLTWDSVDGATGYRIYRASTVMELNNLPDYDYCGRVDGHYYDLSYTMPETYASDYYYAVRAYREGYSSSSQGTEEVYSSLSAFVVMPKKELAAPEISLNYDSLLWSPVEGATGYYIYRAPTREEIFNLSSDASVTYTSSTQYSIPQSYSSDYYYAVRAYRNYSDDVYSALSNSQYVSKKELESPHLNEVTLYGYDGNTYTYRLSGNNSADWYQVFVYRTFESLSEADVKMRFTANPDSYEPQSVYWDTTADISCSITTGENVYFAIARTAYDGVLGRDYYAVSDVKKISLASIMSYTIPEPNSFNLSWNAIDGAVQYQVYCVGNDHGYSDIPSLIASPGVTNTVEGTQYHYENTNSYTYGFFYAVGLDSSGTVVGYTTISRW